METSPGSEVATTHASVSVEHKTSQVVESIENDKTARPYGTRSRIRGGGSRINYAEDIELELEPASPPKHQHDSSNHVFQTAPDPSQKVSVQMARQGRPYTVGENIPGMSSFTIQFERPFVSPSPELSPAPPSSRKRKAPGAVPMHALARCGSPSLSPAPLSSPPLPPSEAFPLPGDSQPAPRRTSMFRSRTTPRSGAPMTFESTQAHLQKNGLVADDGTRLAVDGRSTDRARMHLTGRSSLSSV